MTLRTPPGLDTAWLFCCAVLVTMGFGISDPGMARALCCVVLAYYWAMRVSEAITR